MYPVRYEADFELHQSRPITFFRLILAIPWLILGSLYTTAAFIVGIIAWFAILFTGRYPGGLYDFNAGVLRFVGRMNAFTYLQTDKWPPLAFEEGPDYPVRVEVDPPLEKYSRAKTFFRPILGIPVLFMSYIIGFLFQAASAIAWFHIVFTGRTSGGVHNALTTGLAYYERMTAYFLLMTETLPPISDQEPAGNQGPADTPAQQALPPSPPKPAAPAAPKAKAKVAAKPKAAVKKKAAAKTATAKKKPAAKRRAT